MRRHTTIERDGQTILVTIDMETLEMTFQDDQLNFVPEVILTKEEADNLAGHHLPD